MYCIFKKPILCWSFSTCSSSGLAVKGLLLVFTMAASVSGTEKKVCGYNVIMVSLATSLTLAYLSNLGNKNQVIILIVATCLCLCVSEQRSMFSVSMFNTADMTIMTDMDFACDQHD